MLQRTDSTAVAWRLGSPAACGGLSSLTRNWIQVPGIARRILNHWTTRKSWSVVFFLKQSKCCIKSYYLRTVRSTWNSEAYTVSCMSNLESFSLSFFFLLFSSLLLNYKFIGPNWDLLNHSEMESGNLYLLRYLLGDFPGDPVAKTPCSQIRGLEFNP